jgi:hypothetical protein
MSTRSLIEINHDRLRDLQERPRDCHSAGKEPDPDSDLPYGKYRDRADDRRSHDLLFALHGSILATPFRFAGQTHRSQKLQNISGGC